MLGNVWEWCRDWYCPDFDTWVKRVEPGTGEHVPIFSNAAVCRGGGFESPMSDLRVTRRVKHLRNSLDEDIGVRAMRRLEGQWKIGE